MNQRSSISIVTATMLVLPLAACVSGGEPQATESSGSESSSDSTGTASTGGPTSGVPTTGSPTSGAPTGTGTTSSSGTSGTMPTSSGGKDDLPKSDSLLEIAVLSSRPDKVSGGDALVEIRLEAGVVADEVTVLAGGEDVTSAFQTVAPDRLLGVVEGLELGELDIEATAPGTEPAVLTIHNYPRQGPMISGPHQQPFICRTEESGLGPSQADCSVETRYEFFYKNTMGQYVPLVDPQQVPGDAAKVMTQNGGMIDHIVRVERGTINRAIYQITVLYDPTAPEWTAFSPQPQWTGKVVYGFRGGCGVGHHQGSLSATADLADAVFPLVDAPVAGGMAVLSASLNTLQTNCNDVLTAETAMMVKERFIERYGVPLYTIGWGGSGGSIQQHTMAENYPGVLDGIVPIISYPDIVSIYPDVSDCLLLLNYFIFNSEGNFADAADQAAVAGYASSQTCLSWVGPFGHFEDPTKGCDPSIPADQLYHPVNNPNGVRCTFADNIINLIGEDPNTGHARKIYDNEGVQYGLAALNAGAITKAQFLHINERIGGYGPDGALNAPRSSADPLALKAIYEGGRVVRGNLGLRTVPIVDLRYYTDLGGDIHDRVRSFSLRERLVRENGHHDNHVMINTVAEAGGAAAFAALFAIDAWLTTLATADKTDLAAAVVASRPPELVDLCFVAQGQDPLPSTCTQEMPVHSTPRMTAGAPLVNDILKCTLKPIDLADYEVTFTDMELAQLEQIFPTGVCDWDATGVEQVPALGPWQSY